MYSQDKVQGDPSHHPPISYTNWYCKLAQHMRNGVMPLQGLVSSNQIPGTLRQGDKGSSAALGFGFNWQHMSPDQATVLGVQCENNTAAKQAMSYTEQALPPLSGHASGLLVVVSGPWASVTVGCELLLLPDVLHHTAIQLLKQAAKGPQASPAPSTLKAHNTRKMLSVLGAACVLGVPAWCCSCLSTTMG
jgi:hypothetical protein